MTHHCQDVSQACLQNPPMANLISSTMIRPRQMLFTSLIPVRSHVLTLVIFCRRTKLPSRKLWTTWIETVSDAYCVCGGRVRYLRNQSDPPSSMPSRKPTTVTRNLSDSPSLRPSSSMGPSINLLYKFDNIDISTWGTGTGFTCDFVRINIIRVLCSSYRVTSNYKKTIQTFFQHSTALNKNGKYTDHLI